ncbi:MAG: aspartyl protease family protein [Chitinophagales bacterium]|nr:aspartyl protease family protein [Chitinophagales bacterium]
MRWMIIILLAAIGISLNSQNTVAFLEMPHRLPDTHLSPSNTGYKEVPFILRKGKMLVEARLENEQGYLILDTGAPMMVVNQPVVKTEEAKAFSVSRDLYVESVLVNQLEWGGMEEYGLEALAIDLSHLEHSLEHNILGMLGYEMIKDLNIIIDFPEKKLLIGASETSDILWQSPPKYNFPFEMERHIPVIEVSINDQKIRLGVDTGTESNLIDSRLTEGPLKDRFEATDVEHLQGLDQQLDLVPVGFIDTLFIEGHKIINQRFLATNLEPLRSSTDLQIDGLLGYAFFKNYKCSIDFQNKRIYFW